jgi:NAD(P)-dependent dehydrogenase (short-subunit alcohol dehydrogenase family)
MGTVGPQDGPVAVVTGAGSGIGAAVAAALLADGYRVALAARREAPLREVAGGSPAERVLVAPTDVSDPPAVATLFGSVEDAWGRVDVLFNNAGTFGPAGEVDEISAADFSATVATNLTGSFLCASRAVALMKRQRPAGGRIINNGSISAHTPRPASAAYTATKHAITGLTKSIALDGRAHRICCGQIDIGNAATDMTAGIATGARQADGSVAGEATFDVAHVVDAVRYMAGLPLDTSVPFLTVMATGMPFLGRG